MHPADEVEKRLRPLAKGIPFTKAEQHRECHGSAFRHLGLSLPMQRGVLKEGYSFSGLPAKQQVKKWDAVWRGSDTFEVMSQATLWLSLLRDPDDLRTCWPTAKGWITRCDNWVHSDTLSSAYTRMLELDKTPARVYPTLVKWNRARDPWKRRQSIVSLIFYYRKARTHPRCDAVLPLVEALLGDGDYYVQKGVGWTLREAYKAYPKQAGAFIDANVTRLSSAAFSAATEKHPKANKARLKAHRKAARKKA